MVQCLMQKSVALEFFNGVVGTAKAVDVSYQAVVSWPDVLPARIVDRITAAYARQHLSDQLPPALRGSVGAPLPPGNPEITTNQGGAHA